VTLPWCRRKRGKCRICPALRETRAARLPRPTCHRRPAQGLRDWRRGGRARFWLTDLSRHQRGAADRSRADGLRVPANAEKQGRQTDQRRHPTPDPGEPARLGEGGVLRRSTDLLSVSGRYFSMCEWQLRSRVWCQLRRRCSTISKGRVVRSLVAQRGSRNAVRWTS